MDYKTDQEIFWAGDFGDEYIKRNMGNQLLASNLNFFSRALARAGRIDNCIELGANVGMNLRALRLLYPDLEGHAVEINPQASEKLAEVIPATNIYNTSILDFSPDKQWDLTLIKGVLIHISPDWLSQVYTVIHSVSSRYILLCEYYNPTPVQVSYRGHSDRLFKRDFCGELLDCHDDLELVDYGFSYRRDTAFPQDDITWFLIEKRG